MQPAVAPEVRAGLRRRYPRARRAPALARQVAPHRPRRRRHDRRRHLRHDRHRHRRRRAAARRRAGDRALVPAHRAHLRVRGTVLRGVRGHGADLGLGLHLRVRVAGRAGGLDHRLGPDRGVRGGEHRRGDRVVGVLPGAADPLRRLAPGLALDRLAIGPHGGGSDRRRGDRPDQSLPRFRHRHRAPSLRPPVHRQSARLHDRRAHHGDPDHRHPGVGQLEQRDGAAQDRHHPVLRGGGHHADQARALERPRPRRVRAQRVRRASAPGPPSSSSATSDSTPPVRPRRRPGTRPRTCRSGSS